MILSFAVLVVSSVVTIVLWDNVDDLCDLKVVGLWSYRPHGSLS